MISCYSFRFMNNHPLLFSLIDCTFLLREIIVDEVL